MEQSANYRQILKEILAKKAFDQLEQFKNEQVVQHLSQEERQLLGQLFMMQGNNQLWSGKEDVLGTYEWAQKVAVRPANILYEQGVSCFQFALDDENVCCLFLAAKKFEAAVQFETGYAEAWHAWGNVLVRLGITFHETHYFYEADEKYANAAKLVANQRQILWDWALCWHYLGKLSTEAVDFHEALIKYGQASELGCKDPHFFNDYGNAMAEMGLLLKDRRWMERAGECYQESLVYRPENYASWEHLARLHSQLYRDTQQERHFHKACEAFKKASLLDHEDANLWIQWGRLYSYSGKVKDDIKRLGMAIDCFNRASLSSGDDAFLAAPWAEALISIGALTEHFDPLKEAQQRLLPVLEMLPDNADVWCVYGACIVEMGKYFRDEGYFLEALDKFTYVASLSPHHVEAFEGKIQAYFQLAFLHQSLEWIERALELYNTEFHPDMESADLFELWGIALLRHSEFSDNPEHIEHAISKFEKALQKQRECGEVHIGTLYHYGCALDFMGDFSEDDTYYDRSVQVLMQALLLDPGYSHARYNLALALSHLGESRAEPDFFYQAIEHFQILIKEDAEDECVWNDWGLIMIALAQLLDDPTLNSQETLYFRQESEKKLMQAASLGYAPALYNLGCLYALGKQVEESLNFLEKAYTHGGLPPIKEIKVDHWLDNLRDVPAFRAFLKKIDT